MQLSVISSWDWFMSNVKSLKVVKMKTDYKINIIFKRYGRLSRSQSVYKNFYLLFTYRSNWIIFFRNFVKTISFHYSRNKGSQKPRKQWIKGMRESTKKMLTNTWQSSWSEREETRKSKKKDYEKKGDQNDHSKNWCALVFLLLSFVMINWNSFS